MRKIPLLFNFILFSLIVASGCTRNLSEQTTTVKFLFPVSNLASTSSKTISESASVTTSSFTGVPATSIDEITCYYVFVSGPEDSLKTNTCEINTSSTKYTAKYGIIAGGFLAGKPAELALPSGNDRVITLIGFKASNAIYCPAVKNVDETLMSNPYVVAELGRIKLEPGTTQTIPIKMSFDSSHYVGKCIGPDFNNNGGGTIATPTEPSQIRLQIPFNLSDMTVGLCHPAFIELLDTNNNIALSPNGRSIDLVSQNNYYLYDDYSSCLSDTSYMSGQSTISVPQNHWRKLFFLKNNTPYSPRSIQFKTLVNGNLLNTTAYSITFNYLPGSLANNHKTNLSTLTYSGYRCVEVSYYSVYQSTAINYPQNPFFVSLSSSDSRVYFTDGCDSQAPINSFVVPTSMFFHRIGIWITDKSTPWTASASATAYFFDGTSNQTISPNITWSLSVSP